MSSSDEKSEILKKLCTENAESFAKDSSENGQRLYISLLTIRDTIEQIWPTVTHMREVAAKYDFDENTPGNGFRSFVGIFDSAINYATELNQKVATKKDGLLFIKNFVAKWVASEKVISAVRLILCLFKGYRMLCAFICKFVFVFWSFRNVDYVEWWWGVVSKGGSYRRADFGAQW